MRTDPERHHRVGTLDKFKTLKTEGGAFPISGSLDGHLGSKISVCLPWRSGTCHRWCACGVSTRHATPGLPGHFDSAWHFKTIHGQRIQWRSWQADETPLVWTGTWVWAKPISNKSAVTACDTAQRWLVMSASTLTSRISCRGSPNFFGRWVNPSWGDEVMKYVPRS
jgi:hypothetical protein